MNFYLGVDLGGTNMAAGLVDSRGRIKVRSSIPTLVSEGPAGVLRRMSREILRLIHASGLSKASVKAVGVGSPGPLSAARGMVLETPNLKGWKNVPLARIVAKKVGLKVFLENDANCAALGEATYGAGRGFRNVVVLTLGTGVGGGLILNGELFSGPDTCAGELGHFAIDKQGPLCGCGQRGCLEMFSSATAMARRARSLVRLSRRGPLWSLCGGDLSKISAKMAHDALLLGDRSAAKVWDESSWALATAIGGYINVFNPDRIILFGGVMQGGRELLSAVRKRVHAFPQPLRRARIVRAQLGGDAGLIGAAELAKRSLVAGHAL
jgi:glucokinase